MKARAARAPAVAEIGVLMDVRLIKIDQHMPVALSVGQQTRKPLYKSPPSLRISAAKQLPGLLPGKLEPVQGRADRLAAQGPAEALPHIGDQTPEGPARDRISPCYGRSRCLALGLAHRSAEAGLDPGAKGGRPPVRREASPAGGRGV